LSVGRIEGGTSVNTVPDTCRIEIDRRLVPGEGASRATEEMRKHFKKEAGGDFPVDCPAPWMGMAGLNPKVSEKLVGLSGAAIDRSRGSHRVHPVPYGTDASTLASAGIPSVVFGPGDIAQAHTVDEWVSLDEVEQASEILFDLAKTIPM